MSFGVRLENQFKVFTTGKGQLGEVVLFRHLTESIKIAGGPNKVFEYHGVKSKVEYRSVMHATSGHLLRCELCDLCIISYSKISKKIRITFLQNKAHQQISLGSRFTGNVRQWELLSKRPKVKSLGSVKVSPKTLKDAVLPSVGSFGIFYKSGSEYSMQYSVANLIEPFTLTASSANRTLVLKGINNKVRKISALEELEACNDLKTFGNNLKSLKIGTPMFSYLSNKPDPDDFINPLRSFISSNRDNTVVKEFGEVFESYVGRYDNEISKGSIVNSKREMTNMMLISVDDIDE
ncbi:MAG: hypothetical protein JEZ08_01865 [Clostridiales bacterium]|nr:hypothetical protein [Clostridiales bacterium]